MHYYEQELKRREDIKEWEIFFGKKANDPIEGTGTYKRGVCPPGSYLDPEEKVIEVEDSKPLKETKGKAAGARYCFLTDIGKTTVSQYPQLGEHLAAIVRAQDQNNHLEAMNNVANLLPTLMSNSTLNEVIAVRAQALESGKYLVEGYREKIAINLLLDAAARHYLKMLFVSDVDEESGHTHIAHIIANLIIIHTQLRLYHD